MRRQQAATAVAVLAAMSVGSLVNERLHDPTDVLEQRYERTGVVGQAVPMRTLSVTVHGVSSAAKVKNYSGVATTRGIWLVVDLGYTAKDSTESLDPGSIVSVDGRRFGGKQAVTLSCGVSLPGIEHGCRQIFELPKGVLAGARYEVPTAGGQQGDDVAVIDLQIDQARAQKLEASTATFDAEQENS
ncbi:MULTISPECIES: hypothetical protein [unclassified Luteococcus]|uniref:hypothetical protein n=1 Tax=unclassified Luteococcus TaxID=2639923 RepID=UPI00313A812B